jgi:predicted DNA-binding transcriptional regulator AlpA
MSRSDEQYLTSSDLKDRYSRSAQSLWRWGKNPKLNFPKPMKVNGRLLYRKTEIEAWERLMAAASGKGAAA